MHDCANVITYRSLIDSLCKSSQLDKAIALFNKMKDNGIQPDMYTLNILLHGLCKGKRLKNAQGLFQDLLDKGYHLNVYIYTVMINGLCKEGLIDEAFALWSNMEDSELHLWCYNIWNMRMIRQRNFSVKWLLKAYCKNKPGEMVSSFTSGYSEFWWQQANIFNFWLHKKDGLCCGLTASLFFINSDVVFHLDILRVVVDCFQTWQYNYYFSFHCTVNLLLLCMILSRFSTSQTMLKLT